MCACVLLQNGRTALMIASLNGHTEVVHELLKFKDVDINKRDEVLLVAVNVPKTELEKLESASRATSFNSLRIGKHSDLMPCQLARR